MPRPHQPLALLATLLALASTCAEASPLAVSAEGAWHRTENIGRASGRVDFDDADSWQADANAIVSRQLAAGVIGRAGLHAGALTVPEHDRLDEATVGPRAGLRKKFGLGPDAPWLDLDASANARFGRIDEADGVTLRAAATLGKRLGAGFSAQLRGEWQAHHADAATYDTRHLGGDARLSYEPLAWLRLTAFAGHLDGYFTAGASAARFAGAQSGALGPDVQAYYNAIPTTVTGALQPGWTVYRVEGEVDYHGFEISPALTDSIALVLRYERNHAVNRVDVPYRQDVTTIGLLCSF